jgi:ankyrin repeat protein
LHWASANGHLEVVKLLVARGADVNARAQAVPETVTIGTIGNIPMTLRAVTYSI